MRLNARFCALTLIALAPAAHAIPDENGVITSIPAPDLSQDAAMSARLNYNVGFEKFEQTTKLETAKGAASAVREGFVEAREKFRKAVEADPNLKEAWNLIGYTSRRLGDYTESLKAYEMALKLAPDYPEATEYLAELYLLTGRLDDVKTSFAKLLKSSPSYANTLLTSMRAWVKSAKPEGVSAAQRDAFASWVSGQSVKL